MWDRRVSLLSGRRVYSQQQLHIHRGLHLPVRALTHSWFTQHEIKRLFPHSLFSLSLPQLHKWKSPAQLLHMWHKWVLCKWPVLYKPHLSPPRVQVRGSCLTISQCVTANTLFSWACLVCICVCRCSPGWAGHRCEVVATTGPETGSGGRKYSIATPHKSDFLKYIVEWKH